MLRETVLATVIAGLIAALALTVMQAFWVTPLILKAETFEQSAPHEHAETHEHHHDGDEWKPHDGIERTAFTFAANLLMSIGYAFLLTAVYLLWREPQSAAWGAVYGIAGFIVFFAAPALGLPPDLPGTAAAELTVRQQWWVMIAAATGGGLLLLFSRVVWWARVLGAVLVLAPHFLSAPSPEAHSSLAPEALQTQFRWATAASNAVFWVLLGLISTIALKKLARST
jgi:cobalt transporter subunit CbtA